MLTKKANSFCYLFFITFFYFENINALEYSDSLASRNQTGLTSLMVAVADNDVEGVMFFSKTLKEEVNQQNIGGATALHIAARNKNIEIVKILLSNNININIADNEGYTALMRAAAANDLEIVKLLLDKKSDASLFNLNNETVVIIAANAGCADCLNLILNYNKSLENINFKELQQQLSRSYAIAIRRNDEKMIEILQKYIDRNLAVNAENNNLDTDGKKYVFTALNEDSSHVDRAKADIELKDDKKTTATEKSSDLKKEVTNNKKYIFVKGPEGKSLAIDNIKSPETSAAIDYSPKTNFKFVTQKNGDTESSNIEKKYSPENSVKFNFKKGEEKKILKEKEIKKIIEEVKNNSLPEKNKVEQGEVILFLEPEKVSVSDAVDIEKSKIIR